MVRVSRFCSFFFLVAYGISLGVCMGCLSSIASFTVLQHFGRPDFLIRPDWEIFHYQSMMVSGGFVGILYGGLLCIMTSRPRTHIMWLLSLILTIAEASVVYFLADYLALKLRIVVFTLLGHPIVFVLSLLTVAYLGRVSSNKAVSTDMLSEDQQA